MILFASQQNNLKAISAHVIERRMAGHCVCVCPQITGNCYKCLPGILPLISILISVSLKASCVCVCPPTPVIPLSIFTRNLCCRLSALKAFATCYLIKCNYEYLFFLFCIWSRIVIIIIVVVRIVSV